jgi:hypothetical protein
VGAGSVGGSWRVLDRGGVGVWENGVWAGLNLSRL